MLNSSPAQGVAGALFLLLGYLWLGPGPSYERDKVSLSGYL